MATRFKAEDTPTLETTIEGIDLTTADRVRIFMDHPEDGVLVVNDDATIVDAEQGLVEYEFTQSQTARTGRHRVEFVVEYSDGSQLSYPQDGHIRLTSSEPLNRDASVEELEADPDASVTNLYSDTVRANNGSSVSVETPLEFNGNDVTGVGALSTDEVLAGSPRRNLADKGPVSVDVPGDYDTVQEAVDNIPVLSQTEYIINLQSSGDPFDEDVYISPRLGNRVDGPDGFEGLQIRIRGDTTAPENCTGLSVFVDGVQGCSLAISGLTLDRANPYDDENTPFGVYGSSGRVMINDCRITHLPGVSGDSQGIMSYGGTYVTAERVEFVTADAAPIDNAFVTKHGGRIHAQEISGTVKDLIRATNGDIRIDDVSNITIEGNRFARPRPDTGAQAVAIADRGVNAMRNLAAGINGIERGPWHVTGFRTSQIQTESVEANEIAPNGGYVQVSAGDGSNIQRIPEPSVSDDGDAQRCAVHLQLMFVDSVTVENSINSTTGTIALDGGANQSFGIGDTLQLVWDPDRVNGVWTETSRMIR